jgi:tetratricopeptide (TPR) repeat protein
MQVSLIVVVGAIFGACDTSQVDSDRKIAEGMDALAAGQTTTGFRLLEEATQLAPDNARAHYTLGIMRLQQQHDPHGAISSLDAAVEALPTHAEAHYQRGVALLELERLNEAQVALEQAVENDPQHGRALYRLGRIAVAQEDVPLAIDYLTRSIWASPRFPMPYGELASLYWRFGRPREAVQVLQNALANENAADESNVLGHAQNRADLGQLHYELGEFADAVRYLEQAASMRPDSGSISFNLGIAGRELYAQTGNAADRDAALASLRRAQSRCIVATEQARCESIAAALQELEQEGAPR